jgi:hypothetical protein
MRYFVWLFNKDDDSQLVRLISPYKRTHCIPIKYDPKQKDNPLRVVQKDDVVYVVGHCNVGMTSIYLSQSDNSGLSAVEVAERLIRLGLPNDRPFRLKFLACYSALSDGATGSFAQAAADALFSRGYRHINFFGYTSGITGYEPSWFRFRKQHKYTGMHFWNTRVKRSRIEIHPNTRNDPTNNV